MGPIYLPDIWWLSVLLLSGVFFLPFACGIVENVYYAYKAKRLEPLQRPIIVTQGLRYGYGNNDFIDFDELPVQLKVQLLRYVKKR